MSLDFWAYNLMSLNVIINKTCICDFFFEVVLELKVNFSLSLIKHQIIKMYEGVKV
jgi:hypothetical protein